MALVNAALAWERDAFESDSPISGADLVDWFARWRLSLQAAVSGAPDPPWFPDVRPRPRGVSKGRATRLHAPERTPSRVIFPGSGLRGDGPACSGPDGLVTVLCRSSERFK
ncbi:hypothetical protein, partial [Acetobacter cerevisiae]|uniref:hypothetical protein n=1 Tax=Acetobacter cerevisiae TaxID=178900 RepID=UPI000ADA614D